MQLEAAKNIFTVAKQYQLASEELENLLFLSDPNEIVPERLISVMEHYVEIHKRWRSALETEGVIGFAGSPFKEPPLG